jgi:serine/threonine protein kinase
MRMILRRANLAVEAMGADAAAEEQFGPYLVYERLGVGGTATVHRALERGIEGFERVVALKRLLPHLAADASFIKAFVREAKLASLLNHVNIVQIFELGRVGSQYFISMEHIDGRDIRRILRHARNLSGPPPIQVTVGLLLQLCDALDYAHQKVDDSGHPLGLVHRDVSPSNVLVTINGHVKVIDFGIAKAQSAQLRTQTGRVKGKLGYMAPEALAGKELDARSDLFAVGVIAHELLTARPLFATKNEYETLMKIQRGEVMPPSMFNRSCPPELDAIVLRALTRNPDDRFLHASELRDELYAMRKQYSIQASDRDIASWLAWAFGQAASDGAAGHGAFEQSDAAIDVRGSRQLDPVVAKRAARRPRVELLSAPPVVGPDLRPRPSAPRGMEDDELADLAWGSDDDANGGPVVLADVPDVADQHRASSLGAEVHLALDDLDDDIPTPSPSHGSQPPASASAPRGRPGSARSGLSLTPVATASSRSVTASLRPRAPPAAPPSSARTATIAPAPRTRPGSPGPTSPGRPVIASGVDGALQRSEAAPGPDAGVGVGVRSTMIPPRVRSITIPPRLVTSGATVARPVPALPIRPSTTRSPTPPRGVPSGSTPPRSTVPGMGTSPGTRTSSRDSGLELGARDDQPATERTPMFGMEDLGGDTMPSLPMLHSQDSMAGLRDSGSMTMLRVADPVPAPAIPMSSAPQARLITPATALFAEPDPEAEAAAGASRNLAASVNPLAAAHRRTLVTPPRRRGQTLLIAVAVIVLSGAAAAIVAFALTGRLRGARDQGPPPTRTIVAVAATLAVVPLPVDASIMIDGKPARAGAAQRLELAPGIHQVEVRHEGYKSWLTSIDLAAGEARVLPVTLERLGAGVVSDAAPGVPSAPPDADVAPAADPRSIGDRASSASPIVASTAVTRLWGEPPALAGPALPSKISAQLCIDEAGRVTAYEVLTSVDARTAAEISRALRSWRYAPYQAAGVARGVCFEIALAVK